MAAALRSREPQLVVIGGGKPAAKAQEPQHRAIFAARFSEWPAAAVLAASLVLGVMIGTTHTFETTMQEVAQVTGFGSGMSDSSQLALGDDGIGQIDEELL